MSYIIIGKNVDYINCKEQEICSEFEIGEFDIFYLTHKEDAQSIGIKDLKEMMQKIFLKPLKSPNKAVIIKDAHLLTNEAQNALLKVLEEPPPHTIIVLASNSIEAFLPTIISRCKVIKEEDSKLVLTGEERNTHKELFLKITPINTGYALELSEKLSKNKEDAIKTLENLIVVGRELLIDSINTSGGKNEYSHTLKCLQVTHKNLSQTNINTRLELEHCFLLLSASNTINS